MEGGGEANDGGGSDVVAINIRFSAGEKIVVQVSLDSSVESLKSVIANNSDVRVEEQRLIYKGRLLKDDRTLRSYDLEAERTVYLIRGQIPVSSEDDTTSGSDSLSSSTTDHSETPGVEPIQPPRVQNPGMSLEHLITNPDDVRNMALNNPESREFIDADPNIARIFNNPVFFRNMAESIVIREVVARVGGGRGGGDAGGGGGTPSHLDGTDSSAPPVGLGGPEVQGLERMLGFTPDPIAMSQLMQSPAISQFIQRLVSNTQTTNPERMALHQSPSDLLGEQQSSSRDAGQTSGGTGEAGGTQMNTFSGEGTSGSKPPNKNLNNALGPEQVYASELAQLEAMGFHDTRQNLEALVATKGNIPAAVDRLRGGQ